MYIFLSIEPDKPFYEIGYDEDYDKNKNKNKMLNTYLITEKLSLSFSDQNFHTSQDLIT